MLEEFLGQFVTGYMLKTGIILHTVRYSHLTTRRALFDENRLQGRSHGIYSGTKSARAPSNDYDII
jgi:hypothetical protein